MPTLYFQSDWLPLPTGLEEGLEIYTVGDVHGYCSHLEKMFDVFSEVRDRKNHSILISLGDLIDRGPNSIGAIDLMRRAKDFGFTETYTLMGNHEQMMRLSLTGKRMTEFTRYIPENKYTQAKEIWAWNGSNTTLGELDLDPLVMNYKSIEGFAQVLSIALGPERAAFLDSLLSHKRIGSLLFVHAGINPHLSIEEALAEPWDCLCDDHWSWIRGEFLYTPFNRSGLIAVHGHTYPGMTSPGFDPSLMYIRDGKINLDGGSYRTGKIAGAQFSKEKYRIFIVSE